MLSLSAKIRQDLGKKVKNLRSKDILPAVLYGPKIDNVFLEINIKDFEKVLREAGESSLISLELGDKKTPVIIYDVQRHPLTDKFIHVDFYQPLLDKAIIVDVSLVFEGESPAVKDLQATLIKDIQELEVEALPQKLPHEIRVDISKLEKFYDTILVKDLKLPEGVRALKDPEESVASVVPPREAEEKTAEEVSAEEVPSKEAETGKEAPSSEE